MNIDRPSVLANGQRQPVELPCSVADFLNQRGWKPTQVVVEHNGAVLGRADLARVELRDGDRLEVIVPVAGG